MGHDAAYTRELARATHREAVILIIIGVLARWGLHIMSRQIATQIVDKLAERGVIDV